MNQVYHIVCLHLVEVDDVLEIPRDDRIRSCHGGRGHMGCVVDPSTADNPSLQVFIAQGLNLSGDCDRQDGVARESREDGLNSRRRIPELPYDNVTDQQYVQPCRISSKSR